MTVSAAPTQQFTTTGWPWRPGNQFRFLHANSVFIEAMLAAIYAAAAYVLLEMYLVASGELAARFIAALVTARARGVRVCVVLDGFGALGLRRADRARLTQAGVELRFFNPLGARKGFANLLRDHRKLLLVDGRVAFVGGMGLTDEFALVSAHGPWRDLMVRIEGPVVIDWQRAFARIWRRCGSELALPDAAPAPPSAQGACGRLALSEARQHSVLANGVVARIDRARRRVWIMSAYFVPSRRFRKALRRAARRGIDVRLLLPGSRTDHPMVRQAARRFYDKLLRSGIAIWEYQPHMLHAKMILCDDWVSVGSSNLDRWSFRWNLEANQEIDSGAVAADAAGLFEEDFAVSECISRRRWRERDRWDRIREAVAGRLDLLLDRWRRP
ncbi:MAG: phosphatidylserine/phosphatidylglycerophosphate/cardiolipin synthase family protein [Proteobacteria bacterium]|nr:phosphatidylserine/phosphatidylglycerophosphate/cardiolipin synthase family protein [Pseudomonadota bacterium]